MKHLYLFSILIFSGLPLAGCASGQVQTLEVSSISQPSINSDGYTDIDVEFLAEQLVDKDFTLLNVHVPYAGDIPNTDLSIPFDRIPSFATQLPADKESPIVVYCRSGNMSTQAALVLVELGYTNVQEVDGGMNAWTASGRELDIN